MQIMQWRWYLAVNADFNGQDKRYKFSNLIAYVVYIVKYVIEVDYNVITFPFKNHARIYIYK